MEQQIPTNEAGKRLDNLAERLLRDIVKAAHAKDGLQATVTRLFEEITKARWYLEKKDACEFVEEWGATCNRAAVRVSHGIPCCEDHAKTRDGSF